MALENLANGILGLVNWGITIIVIMFLWELWRFFNFNGAGSDIGDKLKGSAIGTAIGSKMSESWKKMMKSEKKEEKFELKKYVSLEKLEKDVQAASNDAELKKTVGSDERTAKRDESRAYRRLESLEKDLKKAGLKPDVQAKVDKIVNEIEAFNNMVLEKMKEFDAALEKPAKDHGPFDIVAKKTILLKIIKEAVAAERALIAEMQKLNALFK